MSRTSAIILAVVCAPYLYMVWFWTACTDCTVTGESWLLSLMLLLAIPFVLAALAFYGILRSIGTVKRGVTGRNAEQSARGTVWAGLMLAVLVPSAIAAWSFYDLFTAEPEPGRNRIGQICTKEGNSTVCRPDPATKRSALDLTADYRKRELED